MTRRALDRPLARRLGPWAAIALAAILALTLAGSASAAPPNDNFANAAPLAGPPDRYGDLNASGSTVGATKQAGEPNHAGNAGGASVWYTWTATRRGPVDVGSGCADLFTLVPLLAVYTSSGPVPPFSNLTELDSDYGVICSDAFFEATAGTTYYIALDGYGGETGDFLLSLSPPPEPPAFKPGYYKGKTKQGGSIDFAVGDNGDDVANASFDIYRRFRLCTFYAYGPDRIGSSGRFVLSDGGSTRLRGRFVTRRKVKGKAIGKCGGRMKKVRYKATWRR